MMYLVSNHNPSNLNRNDNRVYEQEGCDEL